MSYLLLVQGIPEIRRAFFIEADGTFLEGSEPTSKESENVAALSAVIVRHVAAIGHMLHLGAGGFLTIRGTSSARMVFTVPRSSVVASLELDAKQLSAALEARVRAIHWPTKEEALPARTPSPVPPPAVRPPQAGRGNPSPLRIPVARTGTAESPVVVRSRSGEPNEAGSGAVGSVVARSSDTSKRTSAPSTVSRKAGEGPASAVLDEDTKVRGSNPQSAGNAMFAGDLRLVCLPDLLEFFRGSQRSGTLVCKSRDGSGSVRLRRGKIVEALSPKASADSFLARLIKSSGVSEEKARALGFNLEGNTGIAAIAQRLVEANIVDSEAIGKAVFLQIQTSVAELMGWTDGQFAFHPEAKESDTIPTNDGIDPQAVLLQIFKEQDEANQ